MVADETALVLVHPQDTTDAIIKKVREAGVASVQLLVPDGIAALQSTREIERLRRSTASRGIELLLITSDQLILDAARRGQLEAIEVYNARVQPPPGEPAGNGAPDRYITRALPGSETRPIAQGTPVAPLSEPVTEDDEEFLRSLDAMAAGRKPAAPGRPAAPPSPGDEDIFAALDELSETMDRAATQGTSAGYDAFAAELDALSAVSAEPPARSGTTPPPTTRQRIRPEDIELTADEKRRAASAQAGSQTIRRAGRAPEAARDRADYAPPTDAQQRPARRSLLSLRLIPFVVGLLLVLLAAIVVLLFFSARAAVVVNLPAPATEERPFTAQTIPLAAPGGQAAGTAVQALELRADAQVSATGQVLHEVQAPASSASGVIVLRNLSTQPLSFPQGTEFIAINSQGQEVRFASNDAINLPPATTSRQGAQIITSLGETQVTVTARAPGSASNVEAGTIRLMAPPGQPQVVLNTGTIEVEHGPITGGAEQPVRIVTEEDQRRVLQDALTALYNQAIQQLEAQASQQGVALERTTISPSPNALSQGQGYEVMVTPPVGQPVDPANPIFTVTASGRFSALGTPGERPLPEQIQPALTEQLRAAGLVMPGDGLAPTITNWHWDGARLTVDGVLRPDPRQRRDDLSAATKTAIKASIAGKSRAEAQAALDDLVQRGIISGYTLPDVARLPGWDIQIDLQVEPAPTP